MTAAVKSAARSYWMAGVIAVLGVAIIVNYTLLVPALSRLSDQARAGDKARDVQIKRAPAGCKEQIAFYVVGVISRTELERYVEDATSRCPVPPGPERHPYLLPGPQPHVP